MEKSSHPDCFFLDLDLIFEKINHFVWYTPMKSFNDFVQSAVNATREGDKNPNFSVVAEIMKFLANSSCGYQGHGPESTYSYKVSQCEKTHGAVFNKKFKRLGSIKDQLYEMELVK